ncbi:hypothetical protein HWV62_41116 [Athelia sp. TMB]|nr:hypothetical protein HWV62_41116 [Athelia sp. TMB]
MRSLFIRALALATAQADQATINSSSERSIGASVYNSSKTPEGLPWNTYNYCNAPHVNLAHYDVPDTAAELVHVTAIMRHHKRTPDNLYPDENSLNPFAGWDCTDIKLQSYAGRTSQVYVETDIPTWHPYLQTIWNGTCDAGQLTAGGLQDAIQHGKIDSLVPNYPCPAANTIRSNYQSIPAWTDHLTQNAELKDRLDSTLGTAGLPDWASWYDHYFDTFTSRTCNSHSLPCNASGACVSEEDAEKVYALGDWEYNYIWNAAQNSTDYVKLTFGILFYELAQNLKLVRDGDETHKLRLYVGHDGSMIRLASGKSFH